MLMLTLASWKMMPLRYSQMPWNRVQAPRMRDVWKVWAGVHVPVEIKLKEAHIFAPSNLCAAHVAARQRPRSAQPYDVCCGAPKPSSKVMPKLKKERSADADTADNQVAK